MGAASPKHPIIRCFTPLVIITAGCASGTGVTVFDERARVALVRSLARSLTVPLRRH